MSVTKLRLSRRSFLRGGALSALGLGCAFYSHWAGRMVGGFIEDASRQIEEPRHQPTPHEWSDQAITASWLGHSTVLINFLGLRILTDPVFFGRVGADVRVGTVGPKRLIACPLSPDQLPPIDLILLSHAHMDHFDLPSLRQFGSSTQVVTARATTDLFKPTRLRHIQELGWNQSALLKPGGKACEVRAFEVAHWGARWRSDTQRGYNGYVIEREGRRVLFGGDTAFTRSFESLKKSGPSELAIMPIGAYDPWIQSHCNPEQALQMADMAGGQLVLPVHHATFKLGQEGAHAPLQRLEQHIESGRLGWREVGQTVAV